MKDLKKEKKITVKFFLNEAVEPVSGEDRKRYYPLYVQVTYNRGNMQFKSRYSEYYGSLEQVKPSLLLFEEKLIKSIISFEAGRTSEDYDLKGLKRKYQLYSTSILEILEEYLKPKLRLSVQKTNSELIHVLDFSSPYSRVGLLHQAAQLLFEGFEGYLPEKLKEELKAYSQYEKLYKPVLTHSFPTLIDWVDGSYRRELEKKLGDTLKNRPELIKSIAGLIDHSVARKLKELES